MDWSPELFRSPRGIAVCAAIRAWGREGTAAIVERSGRYPRELVSELGRPRRNGGLTPPALNQGPVCLRFGGGGRAGAAGIEGFGIEALGLFVKAFQAHFG